MEDKIKDIKIDLNELFKIAKERNVELNDINTYVNLDVITVDNKNRLKEISDQINIFDPTVFFKFGSMPMNELINILCLKFYKINLNNIISVNDIYLNIKSCVDKMILVSDIKEKKSLLGGTSIESQVNNAKEQCDNTSYNFGSIAENITNNLTNMKSDLDIVKDIKIELEDITKQFVNYILIGKLKSTVFTEGTIYRDINKANSSKEELEIQKINTENTMIKRVEKRTDELRLLCVDVINLRTIINNIYDKIYCYLNTTVVEEMANYEEEYNKNFGINLEEGKKLVIDIGQIRRSNEKMLNIINNRIKVLSDDVTFLNEQINKLNIEKQKLNDLLLEIQKDI